MAQRNEQLPIGASPEPSDDIDDLIPEELRRAVDGSRDDEDEDEPAPVRGPSIQAFDTPRFDYNQAANQSKKQVKSSENYDEDDSADDYEPGEEPDVEEDGIDDEDLILDDDSIDKLINGDLTAVARNASKKKEDHETPTWHDLEEYQDIVKKVNYTGVSQEDLDKLILSAADTKVLETSKYTSGLEEKLAKLENAGDKTTLEMDRLREIERLANFDLSEEVKGGYIQPMTAEIGEVQKILDMEGINIPVGQVLSSKDRTTLNKVLEDYSLDDETRLRLVNHWKGYKELEMGYTADKKAAQKDLKMHLSTAIPTDVANKILRNSLTEFMKADEKYKYIQEGILKGVDKNPEVSNVLALGKNNFLNLMRALGSPSDYVHNDEWLQGLAKYMFDAAHNKNIADKYYQGVSKQKQQEKNFIKLVKAYRNLAGSAKGITGERNGVAFSSSKNRKKDTELAANDLSEFKGILDGSIKIEDILPES